MKNCLSLLLRSLPLSGSAVVLLAGFILAVSFAGHAPSFGQAVDNDPFDSPVVCIDARLEQFFANPNIARFTKNFAEQEGMGDVRKNIPTRVIGAASLPHDLSFLDGGRMPERLPIDFFGQMIYPSQHLAETPFDFAALAGEVTIENGVQRLEIANASMFFPREGTCEFSTPSFAIPNKKELFSPGLNAVWQQAVTEQHAIRMAIDVQGGREKIQELFDQFKIFAGEGLGQAEEALIDGYYNAIIGLDSLIVGVDGAQEKLLFLRAMAGDAGKAESFRSALDSLIGLGKAGMRELPDEPRNALEVFFESLELTTNGTVVELAINNRPELIAMLDSIQEDNGGRRNPHVANGPVYDPIPVPEIVPQENADSLVAALKEELKKNTFAPSGENGSALLEVDRFDLPNLNFYSLNYEVKSVEYVDGTKNEFKREPGMPPGGGNLSFEYLADYVSHTDFFSSSQVSQPIEVPHIFAFEAPKLLEEPKQPKSVDVEFSLQGGPTIRVFELSAENPRIMEGDVRVSIRDISNGEVILAKHGLGRIELYAFDETGKRLKTRGGIGMGNLSMKSVAGTPVRFKIVSSSGGETAGTFTMNFDVSERVTYPREPMADVPVRTMPPLDPSRFVSSDGAAATVSLMMPETGRPEDQKPGLGGVIVVKSPTTGSRGSGRESGGDGAGAIADFTSLESELTLHGVGPDGPVNISGHVLRMATEAERNEVSLLPHTPPGTPSGNNVNRAFMSNPLRDGFPPETGLVFGNVLVQTDSGVETLRMKKVADGQPIRVNFADGKEMEVTIDRNRVQAEFNPETVLAFAALDENGNSLRSFRPSMDMPRNEHFNPPANEWMFWGQVSEFVMIVREGRSTERIPFEFEVGEYDRTAANEYKARLEQIRSTIRTMREFLPAFGNPVDYHANFAGFHYIHDKAEDGKPMNLIPPEAAHSDRNGAEHFNYQPEPYRGYYFELATEYQESDGNRPWLESEYDQRTKPFQWAGGDIELPSKRNPGLIATPVDPKLPTITMSISTDSNNRITGYFILGYANGRSVKAIPRNYFDDLGWFRLEKWIEIEVPQ